MKSWYLLLATLAVASATTLPTTSSPPTKTCIENCKCQYYDVSNIVQVIECDRPLIINSTTFQYISKPDVNVISLENVIIERIYANAFKEFTHLEDVRILNGRIGTIDPKSFNNVQRVYFRDCGFEDSPNLFSEKLEELQFGNCHIEEIPNLNGLINLTFLNLSGNYIKNVEIEAFAQLFELRELYLTDNEIFKLPTTFIINNKELDSLYLNNNPLKRFYISTPNQLEELSLKNCQLETFDENSTQRLAYLGELYLSQNKIKQITGKALSYMKELSVIDLSYNKLERLDDDVFAENSNLMRVTLDGNNFDTLPNFYLKNGDMFNMNKFSCKHCGLKTLSSTVFQHMRGIHELQLSHNEFMHIDNMFEKIGSLKILDISYNNIAYILPTAFGNNLNLENLDISGNPLMILNPEVFANNHVLSKINARNTSLQKLWTNHDTPLKSIQTLLLGGNFLTKLTANDFDVVPKLRWLDLSDNPFVFTNELCNVFRAIDHNGVTPVEYSKDLVNYLDLVLYEEPIDEFRAISWTKFYDSRCPDITSEFVTTPETWTSYEDIDSDYASEESNNQIDSDEDDEFDEDEDDDDDDLSEDGYPTTGRITSKDENNLARASYILSVTSVFILTALVVLTLAVTVTLAILRRNNNFNMHRANLPRVKIPLWNSTPGQKKHSGSVYRPLSEDLTGPKTPKLSRYEFTSTPTVHSSNP